jgi:nucleoside-diphosphate-sugar epimerase
LTGASGYLGSIIRSTLSSESIISLSRFNADINVDLSKFVPYLPSVDLVIHAAGKAHLVPSSPSEYQDFFEVNVNGTINLLKGLEKSTIPKSIVFISSVSVYGCENGLLVNEVEPLLAKDPYGASKIEAEKIIIEWCKINNVICGILRVPLIVGINPPGNLGSMIKGIKKGYYFNIGGGKAKKSMVLSDDIAKSIIKVAEIGGIYNLTDGYHPTFAELSNTISSQLGKGNPMNMPLWLAKLIAKFGDLFVSKAPLNTRKLSKITSDLTFDDSKARKVFGWNPTPVLEGIKINKDPE